MNNAEFVAHADIVYPERNGSGNPDYGKGWYSVWEQLYNESHGTAAQAALQDIIDYYFPDGRPTTETDDNGSGQGCFITTAAHGPADRQLLNSSSYGRSLQWAILILFLVSFIICHKKRDLK